MRSPAVGLLVSSIVLLHASPVRANDLAGCLMRSHGGGIAYIEYRYRVTGGGWDTTKGSGFVVAGDGHILTNNHVLSPHPVDASSPLAQEKVVVRLGGLDEEERPAIVVRRDTDSDLALLKIGVRTQQPWPAVPLGDSSRLGPGERLTGLGFPGGDLAIVPTAPITALNAVAYGVRKPWLQTGLALNPGNSGGPVFDDRGTVVGLAVAVREGAQQITFVIPLQYALGLATMGGAPPPVPAGPCGSPAHAAQGGQTAVGGGPVSQPSIGQQTIIGGTGGVAAGSITNSQFNLGVPPPTPPTQTSR